MAICSVCKVGVLEGDEAIWTGSHVVHQRCSENLTEQDFQIEELLPPTQEEVERAELKENSTGSDIAASYSNKGNSRGSYMPEKCNANDTKVICNSGRKSMSSGAYYTHNLDFNYNKGNFNFTIKTAGNGVDWTERHYGNCE